jgi:hypothetical protein
MRVYIAGPMRGYHRLNFDLFHAAAAHLRAGGLEVIDPAARKMRKKALTRITRHRSRRKITSAGWPGTLSLFAAVTLFTCCPAGSIAQEPSVSRPLPSLWINRSGFGE